VSQFEDQRKPAQNSDARSGISLLEQLRQFTLTELLEESGRIKTDPKTGFPLLNGANAKVILSILLEGLQGNKFLDPLSGSLWRDGLIIGHGVGIAESGSFKGDLELFFNLNKTKGSMISPEWPGAVLGVPINYQWRTTPTAR